MKDYQRKLIKWAEKSKKLKTPSTRHVQRKIWSEEKLLTQLDKYFDGEIDKGILHIRVKDRLKHITDK